MNQKSTPRIQFTKEIISIFKKLESENNYLAFELICMNEPDSIYHNGLKITKVDVSDKPWCLDVTIDGHTHKMKIGQFIRYFFKGIVSDSEIVTFANIYNKTLNGEPTQIGTPIKLESFNFNPKDVRSTFLSMVTKTYPHGNEEEVLKFLPKLDKDIVGNYYKIVGYKTGDKIETMFTSHLDTADRKQADTSLFSVEKEGDEYIITDESTILGADDKAGVTTMLYMMVNNVPGLYYFFIGEERGGIGSGQLSLIFSDVEYLKNIKRCISFDRRSYYSVITQQMGRKCCSNEFGSALCKEYSKGGLELSLDTTGIYTDSASFIDDIPECTNISVGYMHEHTGREFQNMTFLKRLCEASIKVNWESLPTVRKIGIDQEILKKYKSLISDVKSSVFLLETKIVGNEGIVYIQVDLDESDINSIYDTLSSISIVLSKHKVNPDIIFQETYLKIELR